ncbi:DOA1 [Candida oxycetoniae]|uniref:DOA1 n=1 Tax=Candida oxycetoniae TaxID=497107 RepID=A0AAI9SWZ1_9ASCO|nr:DOA1 [Candida oxycetoniae]KAI3404085.2 DOA1 [Candida oxycetoniae]
MAYKLSSTLSGHEQDVKGLTSTEFGDLPILVSSSRDSTTRVWHNINASTTFECQIVFLSPTKSFLNSTAIVPFAGDLQEQQFVASGGQDAMIYLNDLHASGKEAEYQLIGHKGNVCSLSYAHGLLVSSSWDCTAIVWNLKEFSPLYVLKGHELPVWDVKAVNSQQFLTASADRSIRLWNKQHEVLKYSGHKDVVRKLLILPNGKEFVSCSNDATIRIWNLQTGETVKVLYGHESFIYDLALLPNGNLVSTGEDRSVRVWDIVTGEVLQVITLPCISVWCIAALPNGDFAVGGSDTQIRVFTQDTNRTASSEELHEFEKSVQTSSISEQSLDDLKRTDIPGIEALSKPGKKEGSTIMVKTLEGTIEAHQWSGGQWHKIGDVVGGASNSSSKKILDGREYDYVFDVDIKDGEPPLKLPFNLNENPYNVATKFLADNDLPASYTEEVVRFIETNTAGANITEGASSASAQSGTSDIGQQFLNDDPYSDAYSRKQKQAAGGESARTTSVLPVKVYITFNDYKKELLINGLNKLNSTQENNQLSASDISQVEEFLSHPTSGEAVEIITNFANTIIQKWTPSSSTLIGFDLLRVCLPNVKTVDLVKSLTITTTTTTTTTSATNVAEVFAKQLERGLDLANSSNAALLMMILKVLCNIIGSTLFLQLFIDPIETGLFEYNSILQNHLDKLSERINQSDPKHKLYASLITALASFAYDLSVYHLRTEGLQKNKQSAIPVLKFLDAIGDKVVESSPEATYRLAIAYGNFKFARACDDSKTPTWITRMKELYVENGETRFIELATDLGKLQ